MAKSVKRDGQRRSRQCCDGSKRAAPRLHALAQTYSACVEKHVQRLFLSLAAKDNLIIYQGDASDAYTHSPPPTVDAYLSIDDQYADWYKKRFGTSINRQKVFKIQHTLQGHPEAGRLWQHHIDDILTNKMGFKNTVHDKTIYF